MKRLLHTLFVLTLLHTSKAQMLFYQNTYKGGVTSDGVSYYGYDYLQADTINFQTHVAVGSTIKKAYLLSWRFSFYVSHPPNKDTPIQLNYNNHIITMDSSDIITIKFTCESGLEENYIVAKDITFFTQQSNNKLIIPDQNATMIVNNSKQYVYDGFVLVIMYENTTMPSVNSAIYLNNNMQNNNMSEAIKNLNPINTANDVGLSIWTDNDFSFPSNSILSYSINSSLGNYPLGTLNQYYSGGWKKTLPGSFYYENNTLHGLVDDTPDAFIDSTDALANIKMYIANGATSFSLTSVGNNQGGCENSRLANIIAYSTPCPPRNSIDSMLIYNICNGGNAQLTSSTVQTSNIAYSWYSPNGDISSVTTTPSVVVTPSVTTNYIAYIDSAGCKHTEHFKVLVHSLPQTNSISTTTAVCGKQRGSITIQAPANNVAPYTYNIGNGPQSSNTFGGYNAGVYTITYTVTDSNTCSYTTSQTFTISEINQAAATFTIKPDTACMPALVNFTNTGFGDGHVWFVNGDSSNTANYSYSFLDTGSYAVTLINWVNERHCADTVTQTVTIKDCPPDSFAITIPNIFTPDNDGINDAWQLVIFNYNYTFSNYLCDIYDRWGIKVFESNNINEAWSGRTTSGLPCADDTYFYVIKLTATNSKGKSESKNYKGFIQLIK